MTQIIKEALRSVLPIAAIVLILSATVITVPGGMTLLFLVGVVFLIIGMVLFNAGTDMSVLPMGESIGTRITKPRKIPLIIVVGLIFGFMITIAEPDLQVLAEQVPSFPNQAIIVSIGAGVGVFLAIALLRIILQIKLSYMLIVFYAILFGLAAFTSADFLPVAFDSGGVTTGPITVPFIMALGIGVASARGDKDARDDSFGLVGLCSIGPILAVMLLSHFYGASTSIVEADPLKINSLWDALMLVIKALPHYFVEVGIALLPIALFFIIFQIFWIKIRKRNVIKIWVGMVYLYLGLVVFLTGANVAFMPMGEYFGEQLAGLSHNWILIPIGALVGFFIVVAEPAVHVLTKQVEEISNGAISRSAMQISLSIGIAVSVGLAMIRVLTGLSIMAFLIPGYAIALLLTFVVPKLFTAIAFDSGGVASGPMTATFLLPFALGACSAVGGNLMRDAFGMVAMVAMTPLITIQLLGLFYVIKTKKKNKKEGAQEALPEGERQ